MNSSPFYGIPNLLSWVILILLAVGCSEVETEIEIPEHIAAIENLTILDAEATADSLVLEQDVEYGSTEEVLISRIHNIAVDDRGRVYIEEGKSGSGTIYVYEPDGTWLTTIGRYGRGPGDLLDTAEMQVHDDRLHAYHGDGYFPTQISIFSLEDFSLVETVLPSAEGTEEVKEFYGKMPGNRMFVVGDRYLMNYKNFLPADKQEMPRYFPWFFRNGDGVYLPDVLFELRDRNYFFPERVSYLNPLLFKFNRRSLIDVSDSGYIYTAWSEDFLVEIRDRNGDYLRSLYFPFQKSDLILEKMVIDEEFKRQVSPHELPDTWPALNSIFADEQNRLWVLTYTDSDTHYGGMVISGEGEVLATFQWPGKKLEIGYPYLLSEVRNGYLYARKSNPVTGEESVVRFVARTGDGERF